jgi:hypothetical protein
MTVDRVDNGSLERSLSGASWYYLLGLELICPDDTIWIACDACGQVADYVFAATTLRGRLCPYT